MVAEFDTVILAGRYEHPLLAKRTIDGEENWAGGEFFPIACLEGETLVQVCLLHLLPQGLAVNAEYFRRLRSVAADV